ncbi:MAG: hypothetical protein KAI66_12420 [Lentisphaeria bacterium]|nr:hypothetical protein [Lentisphaeria bacterium]
MNAGLIGGIAGGVIGVIGGAIGTWASIRAAEGPRERDFMVRCSIVAWIFAIIFLGLMFLLPSPWRYCLWVPYGILFPLGLITFNRTLQRIRQEEQEPTQKDSCDQ